jgi:glycosyltransferase involved in cell wall biosynthesis
MAIGLPVVTSNFPLYRDVIEANECGICVDPGNPQEIAEQISKLLNDPERRQRYAENGRRVVKSKYSWEAQRKELEAAYKEVLG